MTRRASLVQLLLGIEGLALLRGYIAGDDEAAQARVGEIRRLAAGADDEPMSATLELPERGVEQGYAEWSKTYDAPGNALIQLEETVLFPLLDALPAGRALDAACGTGRVSARLAANGHDVVGIDMTPEMLERAQARVPQATLRRGRLEDLPVDDASFDLVVCCLALDHLAHIGPAIAELARAARPGGRVVITDIHPYAVHLGGQAIYADEHGARAFVRAYAHGHADYLRAFAAAGLDVVDLLEPPPNDAWFEMQATAWTNAPEAFRQAYEGIPAAIVWSLVKRPAARGAS